MCEDQCPHCGHITTGFEDVEFAIKKSQHEAMCAELTRLRSALAESLEVLKDAGAIVKALSRWPHIVEKAEVIAEATKCADRVTAFIAKHKDSTHEP